MNERPIGIVLISGLILLVVTLTVLTILIDLQISIYLGLFDLGTIILGLIATFGLLNLKPWGWKAGIVYAAYDIAITGLFYFIFADLFLEAIKSIGLNFNTYKSDLLFGFLFTLIMDSIIIFYIYTQRGYFNSQKAISYKTIG